MDRFARVVLGYHGCEPEFADALIAGELPVSEWKPSENPFDWLGRGIYFWEYAPERAKAWGKGGVVGALIQLGKCLDLTDTGYTMLLKGAYHSLQQIRLATGEPMPKNKGKRRDLDCLIINELFAYADRDGMTFQSVRCPFLEGEPAFPGSAILQESHIQIAVRDPACIVGVFRPT
ncbi:hypothetical protein AB1L88_16075 [Tautonia sp. JC769]|uniref:hypothetical protein n=1 Tax=Tautonia sp. JC769 TaxID=3232135 RepID=UPI00345895A4